MNNLKRVLSLALAGTMLAGMMVVGASAADAKDFVDSGEIQNKDAVSTMTALGVINGRTDGSFDPAGTVTRAEMAKMLCVAINGGKDPVLGTKTVPTYSDIKGHWAESYIEYCNSLGIVAGMGNGTFQPNATVTSTQAAKMILGTLGYKADVSGLTGIDWAINTNALANQIGLYEDLEDINTDAAMSRDDAAQMLYNALDAKAVDENNGAYKTSTYTYTGSESVAVGSEKVYVFAVKDGSSHADALKSLSGEEFSSYADADAAAKALASAAALGTDYTLTSKTVVTYGTQSVTKTADETFGHKYLSLITYNEDNVYLKSVEKDTKGTYTVVLSDGMTYTKVEADYSDLMGEAVKVLSKKSDDVYGVFASGGAVLATGIIGDIDDNKASSTSVDFGSGSYKLDNTTASATPVYAFNDFDNASTTKTLSSLPTNEAAQFKAVDLDDDGKVDHVVYTPFTVAKVTYVGSKSFTAGGVTTKFEDANTYDGMAKNDYVMVVDAANTVDDTDTYTKIETIVNGTASATKDSGKQFKIDGEWYTISADKISGSADTVTAGSTVSKAVVVNGYAFFVDTSKSVEVKDYAVVIKAVGSAANGMNGDQAQLLFTDGTKKIVDTDKNYSATATNKNDKLVGKLVTYEVDDDEYTLTAASSDPDTAGFDSVITDGSDSDSSITYTYAKSGKSTVEGKYIAEDAVVFVKKSATSYKVITGAELMKLATANVTDVFNAYADKDDTTGYETISLAYVDAPNMTSGDTKYGYVVSSIETIDDDDKGLVATFTLFDGTDEVSVTTSDKANSADLTNLAEGTVIAYVDDGSYIDVQNVYKLDKSNANIGAITAYNGDDEFSYKTGTYEETINGEAVTVIMKGGTDHTNVEIDDDTVILTINVADKEGVAGGELALADRTPGDRYYANVMVIGNGTTASLIVYCNDILDVIG